MENRDRIQIDGIWYIKESLVPPIGVISDFKSEDVIFTMEREWENDDWNFKASVLMKNDFEDIENYYPCVNFLISDKRNSPWLKHESDNPNWAIGVLENNPDSMPDALEIFGEDKKGLEEFRAFLKYLININWIKEKEL